MLRAFIPALALALVPLTAAVPPAAAADEPETIVVTPGATEVSFTFTVEEVPEEAILVVHGTGGFVVQRPLTDLVVGENTVVWDASGTPDGDYRANLLIDSEPVSTEPLDAMVRVNLVGPTVTAPRLSRTSIFPARDGYRDKVVIRSSWPTSETPLTTDRVEVLNRYGTVVWRSTSRPATWSGRGTGGRTLTPGTFRVRAVAVDADGLRTVSAARRITLSPKKLVTVRVAQKVKPRRFMLKNTFTGKCGKVITPARRGKVWRGSVSLSSNHKCTRRGAKSVVETDYGITYGDAVLTRLVFKVHSKGHRKRSDRAVAFTLRDKNGSITGTHYRRLGSAKKWRTIARLEGSGLKRHVIGKSYYWGVGTLDGARHDVRRFKVVSYQKVLIDPRKRSFPSAGTPARTASVGGASVLR
ncbi:hypothetical protein CLV56_2155 [Mumia flava]|uniref:FlgD-like protein n=1 Tax=Mumia flava TaxID=1348852 RepID=A0A0B2B730_9ACTN|nr:hypothetical protein [Mumia flava]PJJ57916.1 hypothetical protein CLV56_2155 [Mumia flava]